MTLLLCGFAALFVVQLAKVVLTPRLQRHTVVVAVIKMVLALLVSFGAALLLLPNNTSRELVVYSFAGAGLAMALHKIVRLASIYGDWVTTTIIRNRRS